MYTSHKISPQPASHLKAKVLDPPTMYLEAHIYLEYVGGNHPAELRAMHKGVSMRKQSPGCV